MDVNKLQVLTKPCHSQTGALGTNPWSQEHAPDVSGLLLDTQVLSLHVTLFIMPTLILTTTTTTTTTITLRRVIGNSTV